MNHKFQKALKPVRFKARKGIFDSPESKDAKGPKDPSHVKGFLNRQIQKTLKAVRFKTRKGIFDSPESKDQKGKKGEIALKMTKQPNIIGPSPLED